jgi:hypothetical protein
LNAAASVNGNTEEQDRCSRPQGHISVVVDANIDSEETIRIVGSADNIRIPRTEILESPAGLKRPPQNRSGYVLGTPITEERFAVLY